MIEKFKKNYKIQERRSGKSLSTLTYSEWLNYLGVDYAPRIRGMETSLVIIDEDCPDFDLTMPCGPYGDEG